MRPVDQRPAITDDYVGGLFEIGRRHGLSHVGIASADVLERARSELLRRREIGLHDGMQFTYRNPDRSTDPSAAVRGARAVLVGALPYFTDEPAPPAVAVGRIARYAWSDHYGRLREGLWAMATRLRRDGWKAVAYADDNSMVDREIAHRAGIGWFGKNANLLLPGAGSWFVLGSVVTTAPLPVNQQPLADGCGSCHRCIDACPTGAIVAPGVIDAGRCLAWLLQKPGVFPREHREAAGDRLYGCDECQSACPPTVRFGPRHGAPADTAAAWVPLLAVLAADDDEVLAQWGRRYVADRDPRWVRRNALLALGNVGDARDPAVVHAVQRYLLDPDPVLRAQAVWTARRLGLGTLAPTQDLDPIVADELAAAW